MTEFHIQLVQLKGTGLDDLQLCYLSAIRPLPSHCRTKGKSLSLTGGSPPEGQFQLGKNGNAIPESLALQGLNPLQEEQLQSASGWPSRACSPSLQEHWQH